MNSEPATRHPEPTPERGGLARYFVEHREVGWIGLVAVLIWGWFAYGQLPQQEDPKIPERSAMLVTCFPGASAARIEELVTRKLEKKAAELNSLDEIRSQSRLGVSAITVLLRPGSGVFIQQEWEKLRAKLKEVELPEGCGAPFLDTDYGNTVTLLYAITSPKISDAECVARAALIRSRFRELRAASGAAGRAAVVGFFPPAVSQSYRSVITQKFVNYLEDRKVGADTRTVQGQAFVLADFGTTARREEIQQLLLEFGRQIAGTDGFLHPDFGDPFVLMGDEDPLPPIRASAMPRYSYRELEKLAEMVDDELRQVPGVGRVRRIGAVPETVHLLLSLATINGYEVTASQIMNLIATRNAVIPGGTLHTEGHVFPVQLSGEFKNERELLGAVVGVSRQGLPIYLRDIFEVRRGYENPVSFCVDILKRDRPGGELSARRSVLVAVEMKDRQVISRFNAEVQAAVRRLRSRLPDGAEIFPISDQPSAVTRRIRHFSKCFVEAVVIVIVVALFLMDWRSAAVVATAIPLTIAMTLGGMHLLGIPLHQISIAALIIALGMLVDDPVVAADGINRELAHGEPRARAAWRGPWNLRRAILFGTIINIVAFLPLALLPGDSGAFIYALPVVVTIALIASRIVSMTFIPMLGFYFLRGQKGLESGGEVRPFFLFALLDRLLIAALPRYQRLLQRGLERPWQTALLAYGLFAASWLLTPFFGSQFFPPAERNQFLIDIDLPPSASLAQTRLACQEVTDLLLHHPAVENAAVFSGGTAPSFFYNVCPKEPAHYLAQVLVNTRRDEDVPVLVAKLRPELDRQIAGARCVVKQLEQGPSLDAPIQIRLIGEDLDRLRQMANRVAEILRRAGGYQVHDDLGRRLPGLSIEINQERANTLGVDNHLIGQLAQAAFSGLKVTELREGDHLIPVLIRLRMEDRNEAAKIRTLYVESRNNHLIPLESFARVKLDPQFQTIAHFNQLRTVTVKSYSPTGVLPSAVLERARPDLQRLAVPDGYRLQFAGEDQELQKSQAEMNGVMAISLSLIALAMVIQFNSAVKSLVVMLTVPLGAIGAFVGMVTLHASMGFMALLGMVSLAGVIVSHIIVLSDFIEEARTEGMELKEALVKAGLVRLRAVLVTVLATVGGLIPLALTGGALWRPLTAVHIFGLLFATALTLLILPVLYYLFCARFGWIK